MTFLQIPTGASIFLDANTLIYHFANDAKFGSACTQLLKQTEHGHVQGYTSSHVLGDVAHRLMTLEAIAVSGWPPAGIAARLRKHHVEIPKLKVYLEAIARIPLLGIQVCPVTQSLVAAASLASQQYELLTGDGLVVAVMQANGLTNLASSDNDFDRVPALTRFTPV
jgi:predicted nucleic acid-binding protein